ncbi:MAG: hypothetical protein A3A82_01695 [Candidatus Pacebacteria bacterium RIFCSPLOWO2_01_FULL_47_12]|nr:MAG: hypothetical protein A3J60_04175 [Candidatus Pacebacteria bacterium RIFCSPHIGHO2_02_FULL_46_9]OGJ39403.1 MAG: hypothetical protein A3A82_01695 [Candidatus Pacebacteria bacterium RIFCSPLOWO2_01_FULL_47_12]
MIKEIVFVGNIAQTEQPMRRTRTYFAEEQIDVNLVRLEDPAHISSRPDLVVVFDEHAQTAIQRRKLEYLLWEATANGEPTGPAYSRMLVLINATLCGS